MTTPLREVFAKFGFEIDSKPLEDADDKTESYIDKLKQLGGLLLGGAVVNGLRHMTMEVIGQGDELAKSAQRLGLSVESLQAWRHAASLSGTSAEELGTAFQFLARNAVAASEGGQEQRRAFRELGVSVTDSAGDVRDLDSILLDISAGFQNVRNPAERTALAMDLFGRSGARLLPFLSEGPEGIAELRAEVEALGGGFSNEAAAAAEEAGDAIERFDFVVESAKITLVNQFLPTITRVFDVVTELGGGFVNWAKQTNLVTRGLQALIPVVGILATRILISFGPAIAAGALLAAKWALALGAFQDLVGFFTGQRSLFGDMLDKFFGIGKTWDEVAKNIHKAENALRRFLGLSEEITPNRRTEERQLLQGFAASSQGGTNSVQRREGETTEQATARYFAFRRTQIERGTIQETAEDRRWAEVQAMDPRQRARLRRETRRGEQPEFNLGGVLRPPAPVPAAAAPAGPQVNAPTQITFNVSGNIDERTRRAMEASVAGMLDRRNAQMVAGLSEAGSR